MQNVRRQTAYGNDVTFDVAPGEVHGLLGENAPNVDVVGIQYPDGSIQGDAKSVAFRFDTTYMQMAADGKLKVK